MNTRAPRNRTLELSEAERDRLQRRLMQLDRPPAVSEVLNKIICQDLFAALPHLPQGFVDLLIVDPPYNLTKDFNGNRFSKRDRTAYAAWLNRWIPPLKACLKPEASLYFCADWATSVAMQPVLETHFIVRNRITWEREKGRGARANWKNASEDIWFCTLGDRYYFDVDAVKLKRQVLTPYRTAAGQPKDWQETGAESGPKSGAKSGAKKYRLTHPSNLWTDITVPFWSMPENTDHPTQKPEKLIAKLILASSEPDAVVLDPFVGSGTTAVVAKKLGRRYVGIEQNLDYCCLAEKRLALAEADPSIQGYADGVFWERNTLALQPRRQAPSPANPPV